MQDGSPPTVLVVAKRDIGVDLGVSDLVQKLVVLTRDASLVGNVVKLCINIQR